MTEMTEYTQVRIYIEKELAKDLDIICILYGIKKSDFVNDAIKEALKKFNRTNIEQTVIH